MVTRIKLIALAAHPATAVFLTAVVPGGLFLLMAGRLFFKRWTAANSTHQLEQSP